MPTTTATPPTPIQTPKAQRTRRHADDSDVALMLRVQRDEPGAFAELLHRYWAQIFGRFYGQLGDRQEAEDLAQYVFMRLYRARKRYRPRAKFATWLFQISRNVARNAVRSPRRRPWVYLDQPELSAESKLSTGQFLPTRSETPGCALERAEVAGVVRTAVSTLAGRQRLALELHHFQDRTYAQVADEMHM